MCNSELFMLFMKFQPTVWNALELGKVRFGQIKDHTVRIKLGKFASET